MLWVVTSITFLGTVDDPRCLVLCLFARRNWCFSPAGARAGSEVFLPHKTHCHRRAWNEFEECSLLLEACSRQVRFR